MQNKISHDSEVPARGQQVITACAFIFHDFDGVKKVFAPRRAKTKKFLPDVFELPGGHIEYGEDIIDGLKWEIKEEFEMEIEVGEPFFVFTYINEIKGTHSIEVIYQAQFQGDIKNVRINPEDHSEYLWLTKEELPRAYTENKKETDPEFQAIRKGFEKITR